ncbi:hypothetical protein [Ferruginibacter sp.]
MIVAETRSYVMNFIALNVIFNNYEKFINNTLCFKPILAKAATTEASFGEDYSIGSLRYFNQVFFKDIAMYVFVV